MIFEFNSKIIGKRNCAPRRVARKPAWRLNAYRALKMADVYNMELLMRDSCATY